MITMIFDFILLFNRLSEYIYNSIINSSIKYNVQYIIYKYYLLWLEQSN